MCKTQGLRLFACFAIFPAFFTHVAQHELEVGITPVNERAVYGRDSDINPSSLQLCCVTSVLDFKRDRFTKLPASSMKDIVLAKRDCFALFRQNFSAALLDSLPIVGVRVHKRLYDDAKNPFSNHVFLADQWDHLSNSGALKQRREVFDRLPRSHIRNVRPDSAQSALYHTGKTDSV